MVPPTECEADLIEAICPWFEAARISRTASLRHGPPGAPIAEQRSCIVAPLLSRGGLLGFLYVDVGGAVGRFDTTDRDRIAMLAGRAALAIEDRRAIHVLKRDLAERTREAARSSSELALVSSIQGALAAARDMQAIYDAAGDKIREIFQLADVGIRVYDAQSGMMSFPYFYESGVRLAVDPVPWSEVGSTKDFPGGWAGYAVHEGGVRQVVRRVSAPDVLPRLEHTRRAALGVWQHWSPGRLTDRCFTIPW
jgi:hypothetical protein